MHRQSSTAMSKKTTIYVLFKEFPDPNGRGKSAPYIQDSVDYLTHKDALMQDWEEIRSVLEYFSYEPANKYYDQYNVEGLLYVARVIPEEYPGQDVTILADMQSNGMTPWQSNPCTKTDTYHWFQYDVTNDLLGDFAQRDCSDEPCVLLHKGAIVIPQGGLQIDCYAGTKTLAAAESIIELHDRLSARRSPVRNYKFHPKHGDAHNKAQMHKDRHGNLTPSAQLLTDTPATENLLKKAVGATSNGDLWFYDDANTCFIYFEYQNETPQNEYHAYHLHPGQKNFNKIDINKLKVVQPQIP
jgi:hypothetical protein